MTNTLLQKSARQSAQIVCHAYPLASGAGRIANSRLFRRLSDDANPEVVARLRGGGAIHARLDDFVGRSVFYFGDLDPKIRWICRQVLRPGDVVVDVGANIGIVTLTAARLVGPTGAVHAVEPQAELAKQIRKSATLNRYAHVSVHSLALSDHDGTMTLTIPPDNSGAASLEADGAAGQPVEVPVRRTDDFIRGLGVSGVRLLKLDVEGHEAAVIAGGAAVFAEDGPEVIVFEEHGVPVGEQPSVRLLTELGYDVLAIPKAKFRPSLVPLGAAEGAHDFVAIRRDAQGLDALR